MTTPNISPDPLMKIATAPWMTRVLTVAVESDLFTHISSGVNTFELLQTTTGIPQRPLKALLTAAQAMEFITSDGAQYQNSAIADHFLVKGRPSYFGNMILMMGTRIYNLWSKLEKAVETDLPQIDVMASIRENPELAEEFTAAMHNNAIGPAKMLCKEIDFTRFSYLLDVGGGSGAYPIVVVREFPHMQATIFDAEAVCNVAKKFVAAAQLSEKISIVAGDVFSDTLPSGSDMVLLSQVLHTYGKADIKKIFGRIFDVLPTGGVLIINEFFLNSDKSGPLFSALFSVLMLLESAEGTTYSKDEITSLLHDVGFTEVSGGDLAGPHSYLIAQKS